MILHELLKWDGKTDDNKDDLKMASLEKKIDALTDFISKNVKVEKPKTMEEMMAELKSDIVKELGKKDDKTFWFDFRSTNTMVH